jgi:CHAT domain-containing protein
MPAAAERIEGPAATRDAIRRVLAERDLVHVAGHGFEAPEAPALGGVRVADGWFSAEDVPERVAARLVVLAACRTGGAHGPAGHAWGGLPQALLAAGARHVLYTTSDVEDEVTADLTSALHAALPSAPPAAAFGQALERVAADRGHPGGLLAFRLTGFEP